MSDSEKPKPVVKSPEADDKKIPRRKRYGDADKIRDDDAALEGNLEWGSDMPPSWPDKGR